MPLFAVVGPKRLRLVTVPLGALQGLNNFGDSNSSIVGDSNPPNGHFFFELIPNVSELGPIHRRLLPLCSNPAFSPTFH
jgi:hypothetical protein